MGRQFPQEAAISLALAWVQHVADGVDARLLFFKGVAAQVHGLRDTRPSADVDVLVHPDDLGRLIEALQARGWRSRGVQATDTRVVPSHAVTLVHAQWPCDLDLHYYFVGTFADPVVSFEAMWRAREIREIAGVLATLPPVDGHAMLLAINTVRDTGTRKATHDAEALAARFRAEPEMWECVRQLGEATRSLSTLREFALAQGLPAPEHDLTAVERRQLNSIVKYKGGALGALKFQFGDRSVPLRQKLHTLRHYLYKSRDTLRSDRPGFDGGSWEILRANVARVGTGFTQWRQSRRIEVHLADDASSTSARGDAFAPTARIGELSFAHLKQTGSGVVLTNAPEPAPLISVLDEPGVDASTRLRVPTLARMPVGDALYVMSLDPDYLSANVSTTPPVVCLDQSGQDVIALVSSGVASMAAASEYIAREHGVERRAIEPGLVAFAESLAESGILVSDE